MNYILLRLDDAKALAEYALLKGDIPRELEPVVARFIAESGGDLVEIATALKNVQFCPACIIEGQQHSCSSLFTNYMGRRLHRLIVRANNRNFRLQTQRRDKWKLRHLISKFMRWATLKVLDSKSNS